MTGDRRKTGMDHSKWTENAVVAKDLEEIVNST